MWGKKIEREIREGGDAASMTARAAAQRALERAEDIEKVKRRRIEREEEKAQREREAAEAARMKAWEEGLELNRKEESFHLEQAKVRAAARLVDGRGTAADVLAKELHLLGPPWRLPAEASPPHLSWVSHPHSSSSAAAAAAKGGGGASRNDSFLSLEELKELVDDVRGWIELDCAEERTRRWWSAALVAAEDALAAFQKNASVAAASSASAAPAAVMATAAITAAATTSDVGVHASVDDDVRAMLSGKDPGQLLGLEQGIRARLASGELPDPDYWASVLRRIARARARAELGEMHRVLVADAAEACAAEDAAEAAEEEARRRGESGGAAALKPIPPPGSAAAAAASVLANAGIDRKNREVEQGSGRRRSLSPGARGGEGEEEGGDEEERGQERASKAAAAGNAAAAERSDGRFSPPPLSSSEAEALLASSSSGAVELVDADEDARLRTYLRARARYHAARRLFAVSVAAAAAGAGFGSSSSAAAATATFDEGDSGTLAAIYRALALAHGSASDRAVALEEEEEEGGGDGEANAAAASFRSAAAQAMAAAGGAGDFPFTTDALSDVPTTSHRRSHALPPSALIDDDRYRPRKPLFHIRVHTGFDWNKYNSTHYSTDNPPPKVVQGYKFNIFYPDLLDPKRPENAPKYSLERDPRSGPQGDTCLLRFSAGAPYDDLVFRIVNREWEYQKTRGFRCVFDRGIMQLYFNFKRTFYRR